MGVELARVAATMMMDRATHPAEVGALGARAETEAPRGAVRALEQKGDGVARGGLKMGIPRCLTRCVPAVISVGYSRFEGAAATARPAAATSGEGRSTAAPTWGIPPGRCPTSAVGAMTPLGGVMLFSANKPFVSNPVARPSSLACAAAVVMGTMVGTSATVYAQDAAPKATATHGSNSAADYGHGASQQAGARVRWLAHQPRPAADDPCVVEPPAMNPAAARVVSGGHQYQRPKLRWSLDSPCLQLSLPLSATIRGDVVNSYAVDADRNVYAHGGSVSPQLRVGAILDSGRFFDDVVLHVEYEHDLLTGATGGGAGTLGTAFPDAQGLRHELRKAYVRITTRDAPAAATMAFGYQTSHWGLGLVANDGAHGWTPGSGRFSDPRSGDRVLRMQIGLISKPLAMLAVVNADFLDQDLLSDDDVLLAGDSAAQFSGALLFGVRQPSQGGIYVAYRKQQDVRGNTIHALAIDVAGKASLKIDNVDVLVEGEFAFITGDTQLGASPAFPNQSIQQLGAALRATAGVGKIGGAFDFLFASGDRNPDDGAQNGFRVDPNYEMGLMLFRQVMAAQTARGGFRAADPTLVGVPAAGVERIATRQSPTNTVSLFPRVWWRPSDGFDVYGGPLFAFAPVDQIDAFNTRIAGGQSRNALNGTAGQYLGTELDLGSRYRLNVADVEGTLGVEGGVLFPGSAFEGAQGEGLGAVYGGRAKLAIKL